MQSVKREEGGTMTRTLEQTKEFIMERLFDDPTSQEYVNRLIDKALSESELRVQNLELRAQ